MYSGYHSLAYLFLVTNILSFSLPYDVERELCVHDAMMRYSPRL
jgi:hypothetical protein